MLKWTFKVSPAPPNLSTAKLTAHCTFPWSLRTRLYQCFPLFGYHGSTCSTLRIGCIDPCTEQRWQRLALWSAGGLGLPGPRGGTRGSRGRGWARHHWRGCTATEAGTPDFDLVWPRCGAGGRRERWEVMARWDDEVGIGKKLGFLLARGVAIAKACHDEDTDVQVGARGWRSITFLEAFPTLIWHMWTLSILLTKVHHARCILLERLKPRHETSYWSLGHLRWRPWSVWKPWVQRWMATLLDLPWRRQGAESWMKVGCYRNWSLPRSLQLFL